MTTTQRAPSATILADAILDRLDHRSTANNLWANAIPNSSLRETRYEEVLGATVKAGNVGAGDVYWASCHVCSWWNATVNGSGYLPAELLAQAEADEHNRIHHGGTR